MVSAYSCVLIHLVLLLNRYVHFIFRDTEGKITSVHAETNLGDTDYKKTLKLTWLAKSKNVSLTPVTVLYYDHIISKPVLGKDEDFKKYINKDSKKSVKYIGDDELKKLQAGDIIQLQRIGFFRCDIPYGSNS